MRTILSVFALFLLINFAYSQKIISSEYDWESAPKWYDISEDQKTESYIFLKSYFIIEYFLGGDNDFYMYQTTHYIVYLADDHSVDVHNKVYIPFNDATDIINIKARTYDSNGNVTNFDRKNIKESENAEDNGKLKLFALDGVQKGNQVEVFYTLKKEVSLYGVSVVQKTVPARDVLFQVTSPKHLVFTTRMQNGTAERTDTVIEKKRITSFYFTELDGLTEEEYSTHSAQRVMVDYKFSYNLDVNTSEKYTYALASQTIYGYVYSEWDKYSKKLIKIANSLKLGDLSEEDKIKAVENYVKKNYREANFSGYSGTESLEFILKYKATSSTGLVKLTALILKAAGIDHQVCITNPRDRLKVDPDFMSWPYLDNFLIYFPGTGKYMSPGETQYRYPMFDFDLMDNNALFIKTIEIGGIYTALHEIKKIPVCDVTSYHNTKAVIRFSEDMKSVNVEHSQSMLGFSAMFIQPYYNLMPEEDQKKFADEFLKTVDEDVKVESYKVTNTDPDVPPIKDPLNIDAIITSSSLIDQAGENIILKVGKIIGKQSELYPEEERKLDIDIQYPHSLSRSITVIIPEGYKVKGCDGVKSHVEGNNLLFSSDYRIEDNKVIVTVEEKYSVLIYPVTEFQTFQKVINAAAEFTNSVIIFEKVQ